MKTPGTRSALTAALALLGLVLVAAQPGLALAGGHGGGGHSGGGGHAAAGGHFGGGGGAHFGGGHFAGAGHVAAGAHFGGVSRFSGAGVGGHAFVGHAYGGGVHFAAPARGGDFAAARAPIGYGRFAHGRPLGFAARGYHWGGGYWGGHYWPAIYWGANVAWFLPVIPAYCSVYWWGGVPYYYYDDAYYTWDPADSGYVATAPPPATIDDSQDAQDAQDAGPPPVDDQGAPPPAEDQGAPPPADDQGAPPADEQSAAPPPGSDNLYAYPKNGQSDRQQAQDKLACEQWAAAQTSPSASQSSSIDYRRALVACLNGRGYSVD